MTFEATVETLRVALATPLPGSAAQQLLAPTPRTGWPAGFEPDHLRHAAGLLLLFPRDGQAHLVLTVRGHSLGRHGGQVSLPGGVVEPNETIEQAAVREAAEEVGIDGDAVSILGLLTPIDIPVSGFRLHPVVGALDERPVFHPAHGEVASILEPSVDSLLNPATIVRRTRERQGLTIEFPAFLADSAEIWGATAMVLAEFLTVLGWQGPPRPATQ